MAKDHSHPQPKPCMHDLGWCEKCARPYCKACGVEWYDKPVDVFPAWQDYLRKAPGSWATPFRDVIGSTAGQGLNTPIRIGDYCHNPMFCQHDGE